MRACWLDEGNGRDDAKLRANRIDTICRSIRDPLTTPAALQSDLAAGYATSVYVVASWYPLLSGSGFADKVSELLEGVAPNSQPSRPAVCVDIEVAGLAAFVTAFTRRWRQHRPKRVTDLAVEGHQGGLLAPIAPILVSGYRYIVPECYDAVMVGWDTCEMARDLVTAGIPLERVQPFHDAARLDNAEWWQGYAFTQGRLI